MNWRKIAVLASSLTLVGTGTIVSTTNAFADDVPVEDVQVTVRIKNTGAYVGDVCVMHDSWTLSRCEKIIHAGDTKNLVFRTTHGNVLRVEGYARMGSSKTRELTVGTALEETDCFLFSGTTFIGFKFRQVPCNEL